MSKQLTERVRASGLRLCDQKASAEVYLAPCGFPLRFGTRFAPNPSGRCGLLNIQESVQKLGGRGVGEFGKDMLARKRQVRWIIDFGPGQTSRAREAHLHSRVGQFLYGHIEKFVDVAMGHKSFKSLKKFALDSEREGRDANVRAAEFRALDFLAHFHNPAVLSNDLHGFVAPLGVDDHGDRRSGSGGGNQDIGVTKNIRIKAHEGFAA